MPERAPRGLNRKQESYNTLKGVFVIEEADGSIIKRYPNGTAKFYNRDGVLDSEIVEGGGTIGYDVTDLKTPRLDKKAHKMEKDAAKNQPKPEEKILPKAKPETTKPPKPVKRESKTKLGKPRKKASSKEKPPTTPPAPILQPQESVVETKEEKVANIERKRQEELRNKQIALSTEKTSLPWKSVFGTINAKYDAMLKKIEETGDKPEIRSEPEIQSVEQEPQISTNEEPTEKTSPEEATTNSSEVKNLETETLPLDFIKETVIRILESEKTLSSTRAIREIENVKIEGKNTLILLSAKAKAGPMDSDVEISVSWDNMLGNITVRDFDIKTDVFVLKKILESSIRPQLEKMSQAIKSHVEKEEGKEVVKIETINGELLITSEVPIRETEALPTSQSQDEESIAQLKEKIERASSESNEIPAEVTKEKVTDTISDLKHELSSLEHYLSISNPIWEWRARRQTKAKIAELKKILSNIGKLEI